MSNRLRTRLVFPLILIVIVLSVFEFGAFMLWVVHDDFYSHEALVLDKLEDSEAEYTVDLRRHYDSVTGWRNEPSGTFESTSCQSRVTDFPYLNDALGARRGEAGATAVEAVRIVAVGDSYTYGEDVAFEDSYPARLAHLSGTGVANQGVFGFGPLQATLRFEQIADAYPNAEIAILGIMQGDIRRMLTRYFPVIFRKSILVGFKPYVALSENGPEIHANPNGPTPGPFPVFLQLAKDSFRTDYWRKEKARFPYSWSFIKSFGSNYVRKIKLGGVLVDLGFDDFTLDYRDQQVTGALTFVIDRFVAAARDHGMRPVVAFIPKRGTNHDAPRDYLAGLRQHLPDDVLLIDVGQASADWSSFGWSPGCHPSPAGYALIADGIFQAIQARGWLPPSPEAAR